MFRDYIDNVDVGIYRHVSNTRLEAVQFVQRKSLTPARNLS